MLAVVDDFNLAIFMTKVKTLGEDTIRTWEELVMEEGGNLPDAGVS